MVSTINLYQKTCAGKGIHKFTCRKGNIPERKERLQAIDDLEDKSKKMKNIKLEKVIC